MEFGTVCFQSVPDYAFHFRAIDGFLFQKLLEKQADGEFNPSRYRHPSKVTFLESVPAKNESLYDSLTCFGD